MRAVCVDKTTNLKTVVTYQSYKIVSGQIVPLDMSALDFILLISFYFTFLLLFWI